MLSQAHVVITAADAAYYELVVDLVSSIRDQPRSADVALVVFDLGLTAPQRDALAARQVSFVTPGWDYDFPTPPPEWFKAMTARTRLPQWVPGFEHYLWIDADAWLQRWETIELLIAAADQHGFAVVAEADRAYSDVQAMTADGKPISTLETRLANLRGYFGDDIARRLGRFAALNCGVFAARADSPVWTVWPQLMAKALCGHGVGGGVFFAEQTALNVALLSGNVPYARLPAEHNWLLTGALPRVGHDGELVHPDFPHEPLGIIHRAAATKHANHRLRDIDGHQTNIGTAYRGRLDG